MEIRISYREQREGVTFSEKLICMGFTQFHGTWENYEDINTMDRIYILKPTHRDLLTKNFDHLRR